MSGRDANQPKVGPCDRCYLCGETLLYRGWLRLPSVREGHPVRVCRGSDACRKRVLAQRASDA